MRPYADLPGRRALQIFADLLAVLSIYVAVRIGMAVRESIASIAVWGERVEDAGSSLSTSLVNIGTTLSEVPLLGPLIGDPFTGAAASAAELELMGIEIQDGVNSLATKVGLTVAILPIVIILIVWLVPRLRFAVRAARIHRVASHPAGRDLLAIRALASAPLTDLQKLHSDIATAWRAGDDAAITALATLTLKKAGVKVPRAR